MRFRGSDFDSRVGFVMSVVKKRSAEGLDSAGIRSRSFSRHNWILHDSLGPAGLPDGGGDDDFLGGFSREEVLEGDGFGGDGRILG